MSNLTNQTSIHHIPDYTIMIEEIHKDSERKKANSKLIYLIVNVLHPLQALIKNHFHLFIYIEI